MSTEHYDPSLLIFIQSRAEANPDVIDEYTQMYRDGVSFDPAQAISDGKQVYVWDGYHRGEAARKAGMLLFLSIKPGTREDAEWLALTANQKHGLRRNNEDKRRVVELALQHPKGAQMSDNSIAHHCGVSQPFVGKIRAELNLTYNGYKSDGETTWEFPKSDGEVTGNRFQSDLRLGADGRTINTANIGGRPPSVPPRGGEGSLTPTLSPREREEGGPRLPPPLYGENKDGNPYAITPCPKCEKHKIVIFPSLNRVSCDGCGRVWNTTLAYHIERQIKFEKEQVEEMFHVETAPPEANSLGTDIDPAQGGPSPNPSASSGRPERETSTFSAQDQAPAGEFDCPYCGQEKVVHVNGGAWCLNCDRRWPSPEAFKQDLASYEVQKLYLDIMRQFSQIARAASVEELRIIQAWLEDLQNQKETGL